ncbi:MULTISPECIES: glutamate racemase [unclassified Croceitalea]|uniref:glutamate racemase n=1 Tax=unclassified Croceitalea TaxID=2632280 RepID=UPI0030D95DE1
MHKPIGIFDSGVGGTSIWKELHHLMPNESTIYLADSKNAPYGEKPKEEILRLSIKKTELLLEMGAKIIVVACNTATTNAIEHLRKNYNVPFIGIEPAIKPAALQTKTKKVGVLATKGTLSSSLFHNTSKLYTSGIEVYEQEGKGLVELIESGLQNPIEVKNLLEKILEPILLEEVDCLVLGCTHYPYLIPILKDILPKDINIVDSGAAVAQQTKNVLKKNGLLNFEKKIKLTYRFYSNSDIGVLKKLINNNQVTVSYLDF